MQIFRSTNIREKIKEIKVPDLALILITVTYQSITLAGGFSLLFKAKVVNSETISRRTKAALHRHTD